MYSCKEYAIKWLYCYKVKYFYTIRNQFASLSSSAVCKWLLLNSHAGLKYVLCVACWKYRMQKIAKSSGHHCTTLSSCVCANKARIDHRKKLLDSNISFACFHNMVNFSPLAAEIGLPVWGTPPDFIIGFSLCLRYCSDVVQRRSTKLCTMFGRLLGWFTIYAFSWRNFTTRKFTLRPSLVFSYIGSVLQSWASAKLCGVQQRASPIFGRATATLGIGSYSSFFSFLFSNFQLAFRCHYSFYHCLNLLSSMTSHTEYLTNGI